MDDISLDDAHVGARISTNHNGPSIVRAGDCQFAATDRWCGDGAHGLRGGAYKPRTSPRSFQGLGEPGLKLLARAGHRHALPVVTEVMDAAQIPLVLEHAQLLQVGARNMQNFMMLDELGTMNKPILLKRGLSATIEETLSAAEYVLKGGNRDVMICERGIRTFETYTRNTLDLAAVAALKSLTHLPIIVDPSHATGRRDLVSPMSRASVTAGADGVMVEVHPDPEHARCDGPQSLTPAAFAEMMSKVMPLVEIEGKHMGAE